MKVSLNWLSEFIDLTLEPDSLSELLTMAGVEVEGIEQIGGEFPNVVVAQILTSEPHPNADRLSVCTVDDGSGTARQIVCGAKNFKVGDKVPCALPGAVLPGNFKIKKGKLRGVESDGMMCSAAELRLAKDSEGLLILPKESIVGTPVQELFPSDTVFDLEITPNRGDLLSHLGLARELSVLTKKALIRPEIPTMTGVQSSSIAVVVNEPVRCPLYSARRIRNVKVSDSPDWLRHRLEAVGLRSINNIVDITNFILFETGQPLHTFDADKINGSICIRLAKEGETFEALDEKTYTLTANDLVIADDVSVLALAGVMGGKASGVTEQTTEVILESAVFEPSSVRRTSRRLGLFSDSSYRFERGIDEGATVEVSARATELIVELASGEAEQGIQIVGSVQPDLKSVTLRGERCRTLLGVAVSDQEIDNILMRFGLRRLEQADDFSVWQIPSHRNDLSREVDLIEEVARVYGLDRVPVRNAFVSVEESAEDIAHDYRMDLRHTLQGIGFHEARTLTLISESLLKDDLFGNQEPLRVRNPLGEDSAALRPSLIPGLIHSAAFNARQGIDAIRLFEIGRVFRRETVEEKMSLGLVLSGNNVETGWRNEDARESDFFDFKGILASVTTVPLAFRPVKLEGLAVAVEIFAEEKQIGVAGQLWPKRVRALDIRQALFVAELDIAALQTIARREIKFKPWRKFPSVRRDIAMLVKQEITHQQIEEVLSTAQESLLVDVTLFDIFQDATGEKIARDMKSVAYALTYQSDVRTLNSDEVNDAHNRLKQVLRTRLNAEFRE